MQRKKNRKQGRGRGPLIRLVGLNAAVATAGLAGPAALAAPGDLDPSFGDVGRQSTIEQDFWTTLTSVDVAGDDSILFGGGGEYCYWGCYEGYFLGALRPDGTPDPGFVTPPLTGTVVRDTALQPDGKVIGVGRTRAPDGTLDLQVFRLLSNGAFDPGFGIGGLATIDSGTATSVEGLDVVLEADGRIVVAGFRGLELFAARFLDDGTLDPAFGTAGVYAQAFPAGAVSAPLRIVRAAGGGYRLLAQHAGAASGGDGCGVRALTAGGTVDTSFGQAGVATVRDATGAAVGCGALAAQSDGKLLVGGASLPSGAGYLGRLLPDGTQDTGFDATLAAARLDGVRAVAAGSGGSVLLAGNDREGSWGAVVMRLGPDGALDPAYGKNGLARIDLAKPRRALAWINDLQVLSGGRVVAAGTSAVDWWDYSGFVVRLLGDTGAGPGVLGLKEATVVGTEQQGTAALTVMRSGGRTGATAVNYTARAIAGNGEATAGSDFTAVTGRLTWADGDDGDREIVVPLAADAVDEPPEFLEVVLTAPEGGAGLGASGATVEIAGAGYPHGWFTIRGLGSAGSEGNTATFVVTRNYYGQGAVSVTVRVASGGTASPGEDFTNTTSGQGWQDVVLSWQDGEYGERNVTVKLRSDIGEEPTETFTLELASPTGGTALGNPKSATMSILNVAPQGGGGGGGSGGGGAWGGFGVLLLAFAGIARRLRARLR